ncbi:hypothetical protein QFZ60_001535 [Arthrobacter sp. B2I5]|uniref:hypothetical protein n=1 Tax=Arthrobacter sp. B2I5 TaxID=3042266 RepID=UPI002783B744|nr:hypothetical protein [Arthrobacter sp. B2I5]MDQ0825362.1 hypothetical protein [Arthrobacter sp. B2I5]
MTKLPKGIFIPVDNDKPLEVREFTDLEKDIGGAVERFAIQRPDASLIQLESAPYLDLDTNRRGTLLRWAHATFTRGRQVVQGDVVLLGAQNDSGGFEAVPHWYVRLLLEAVHFKVHALRLEDNLWREHERVFDDWQQAYTSVLLHAERNAMVACVRVVPA